MPYRRKGSDKYYISVKGVRKSSGTESFANAKALEDKLNHDLWLQERMGIKPPRSWKEAAVKWLQEKAGKASIQDDIERLRWLDAHLVQLSDINHITRELVDSFMRVRSGVSLTGESSQNSTANKYVALIAGILSAAEREWSWGNRAPRLRYYKTRKDVGRALTVVEWLKLSAQLPEPLRQAATFAIATGMRCGKVFGLRWDQISLTQSQLSFRGEANKLGNTIPLNQTALSVLRTIRSGPVVHATNVFTYSGKAVKGYSKDTLRDALGRAGLPRMRFHDLRVTFNTWLAQNGVPEQIQKRLLGHSTNQVHDRYTKLYVEHLRPYACVIDTLLAQSSGQSADKPLSKVG